MEYQWDDDKNTINIAQHGIDFSLMEDFDWVSALVAPDSAHSQNELRFTAIGFIKNRLYVCIYTWRGANRRVISLRKANARERGGYEQET
jgi:uncharacterized DUF497 family protein